MLIGRSARHPWLWQACLLAVALQIMLPAGMLPMLAATFDPLGHAALCTAAADGSAADRSDGLPQPAHICVCPICHVAHAPPIALPVAVAELVPPEPAAPVTLRDPAQSAGPRGPPLYRPQARRPPSAG